MESNPPIACSLDAADLSARRAELTRLGEDALLPPGRDGSLRFRNDRETRTRLEALVAAEAACCPFLDLTVREEPGALVLEISAPDGAEPVVEELTSALGA